ncbi:MAG: hypothetical protein A2Z37_03850 [Chloroflexi bacterium RBG_19FT_COMBO_62_14]|nr:MAG: hypothetical protein A2Z37_03850 [Chloroflexi bacterium RBG_19FT_COMBO_62_14]
MHNPTLEVVDSARAVEPEDEARASFETSSVVTLIAGHAIHDMYTAFLPPLLPLFIAGLSLSLTQAGALSLFLLLPATIQPIIDRVADRRNLRPLVIVGPLVAGVTMSLLGAAPSYAALPILLTVAGLNTAGLHAVAPAMTGRLSGKYLGRGMGLWMVGGVLGRAVGPPVIMALVQESFPEYRALANGMYMAASFATASVGVVIVGLMSDLMGMRPAFVVSALIMLLAVPILALLPGRGVRAYDLVK